MCQLCSILIPERTRLTSRFPDFVACPLHTFLQLVGAVVRSGEERSEDRPPRCPVTVGLLPPSAPRAEGLDDEADERWLGQTGAQPGGGAKAAVDDCTCVSDHDSSPTASPHSDSEGVGSDHGAAPCIDPVPESAWQAAASPAAAPCTGGGAKAEADCEDEAVTLRLLQDVRWADAAWWGDAADPTGQSGAESAVRGWAEEADAALDAVWEGRAAAAELEAWAAA